MEITDIRIKIIENSESKLKAFASVTLDNAIAIHDIKIIQGTDGSFVAMPSRTAGNGEFKDIVHPINSTSRAWFTEQILKAYQDTLLASAN